jgi:DNA-binding winged helix-turn-helix (wHTH) protein
MAAERIFRFGAFELDARISELRRNGVKQKLQGKPLQVLLVLLQKAGQLVTRDELQRQLWPSDVFVDFDSGLNTAINRLRFVLGDSADHPRYVETFARSGYRFVAPVEIVDVTARTVQRSARGGRQLRLIALAAITVCLAGVLVLAFRRPRADGFQFRQVTFRRGQVYTASWDNGPRRLFITNPSSPESRALGFDGLRLVAVSRSGELALMSFDGTLPITGGTLARVPMNGGAPLPIERNIMSADWSADGRLALVRAADGANQLEFPPGTVLHKTSGWMSGVRVSPSGNRIAFVEHPVRNDNRGTLKLRDADGVVRALTQEWPAAGGVAWHPTGDEIWFTASRDGTPKSIWAVTLKGALRSVTHIPGTVTLRDIAADGRALTSRDTEQLEMAALVEGETVTRNLSWLDWSRVADISLDGRLVLFDESGVGGGAQNIVYVHRLDDGSTMRVGPGVAMAFSPDGRSALTRNTQDRTRLRHVPLGEGPGEDLPISGLHYQWVRYFPDGRRLLALASEGERPLRLYVQTVGGKPFPITPPVVVRNVTVSPDGSKVVLLPASGKLTIYPTSEAGTDTVVPTSEALAPLLWLEDDWLYVQHVGAYTQIPTKISRLHLPTGRLQPWKEIGPTDPLGVNAITKVMLSRDERILVFNYRRVLSELFVAEPAAR